MTTPSKRPALTDLLGESLSTADFYQRHWIPGEPLLARPSDEFVKQLRAIPGLASAEALLDRYQDEVSLFGPNAFRSSVPARSAQDFLPRGYNLYFAAVGESLPETREFVVDIARDLGVTPWQVSLEAFAGTAGGVSSRHFDHDVNFQVLLDGDKEWEIERNRNVVNPLYAYHPSVDRRGNAQPFLDAHHASNPELPTAFDPSFSQKYRVSAGSMLFLPRAWWHEVRSVNSTWSINVVVKGMTFASGLGQALTRRLQSRAEFRGYFGGLSYGGAAPPSQAETFAALKEAAIEEIDKITLAELALSRSTATYQWVPTAADRQLTEDEPLELRVPGVLEEPLEIESDLRSTMRSLVAIRQQFGWEHALIAGREVGAVGTFNLLNELTELGLITRR